MDCGLSTGDTFSTAVNKLKNISFSHPVHSLWKTL